MEVGNTRILFVSGKVIPKARSRISTRHGVLRSYTPNATRDYEARIRNAWIASRNTMAPLQPTQVTIIINIFKPKSVRRTTPTSRPDIDNYIKSVLDALNGLAWKDDGQVTSLEVKKRYAAADGLYVAIRKDDR